MQKTISCLIILLALLMSSCAGIKYLTVETRETPRVNLPSNVHTLAIVNNTIPQPAEVGHDSIPIGHTKPERVKVSSDSIGLFYTEALAQFLNEEDYFDQVVFYNEPIRNDKDFFQEKPIDPQIMHKIKEETGADAVLSLDKLLVESKKRMHFEQQGYYYADLTGKIHSILRVYMPTMEGKIPAVEYTDSLHWEGFDIQDGKAYADIMLPTVGESLKMLVVNAAEKMSYVFAPHWVAQDRWYYTLPNSLMREGETFAKGSEWEKAIERWQKFYQSSNKKREKAKAASNIALAYEMLDDMEQAVEWATDANNLFNESTAENSLERKRSLLYKNEVQRRADNTNKLDMEGI